MSPEEQKAETVKHPVVFSIEEDKARIISIEARMKGQKSCILFKEEFAVVRRAFEAYLDA